MFPFCMQDAKDNDALALNAIEKFVREPASQQAAEVAIVKWPSFRIGFQNVNCGTNFNQQFIS